MIANAGAASGSEIVIIPARNEAARLRPVVLGVRQVLPRAHVVVIDDDSTDGTAEVALASGAAVARHPFHLGYGAALLTGYELARRGGYARCLQLDADGQHAPSYADDLLRPLRRDAADVVLGSRFIAGPVHMPVARRFGSGMMRRLARVLSGLRITDPTSGYRAVNRTAIEFLTSLPLPDDYPDVDVLIAMHRAGLRIVEVPVPSADRVGGVSMHGGLRSLYYAYKVGLSAVIAARRPPREGEVHGS